MTRMSVIKFVETACRRWWLFIVPLLLLLGLAVMTVTSQEPEFESSATLNSSRETLLSNLAGGDGNTFTWETPAQRSSRNINELLRTDDFVNSMLARADIDWLASGLSTLDDVRESVSAGAAGENLVRVTATTGDGTTSQRLVEATIGTFAETVIDANAAESVAAQEFFTGLAEQYAAELDGASEAVDRYLLDNPVDEEESRPLSQQIQIDRLRDESSRIELQYNTALRSIEEAELAVVRSIADAEQRLRVIDPPTNPLEPQGTLRRDVFMIGIFGLAGLVLSLFAVGLVAYADRTIRRPEDVSKRLGVELLATVPNIRDKEWPYSKRYSGRGSAGAESRTPRSLDAPADASERVAG